MATEASDKAGDTGCWASLGNSARRPKPQAKLFICLLLTQLSLARQRATPVHLEISIVKNEYKFLKSRSELITR